MKRQRSYTNKAFAPPRKRTRTTTTVTRTVPRPLLLRTQRMPIRSELKQVDVVAPNGGAIAAVFPCNATPSIVVVNLITTGSSAWNRIGRKVQLRSVQVQGYFSSNETAGHEYRIPSWARMMIVYDKQPNGAAPNINDILLSQVNSATDSNLASVFSASNMNNRDRFEILRDTRFAFGPNAIDGNGNYTFGGWDNCTAVKLFVPLKNRDTQFKADSSPGVIGDIATGSLLFITFGDVANTANPFDFSGTIRVRYSDS